MTEQRLQTKIIKKMEAKGYYVINLIKTNKNGIADLLCLKDGESPVFIEVKRPDGKGIVSSLQRFRIKEQKSLGFRAIITDNINFNYND